MSDNVPQPSALRRWIKNVLLGITLTVALAIASLYGLKLWVVQWSSTPLSSFSAQDIIIKAGDNTRGVIKQLDKAGAIEQAWPFKLLFALSPQLGKLKVGHYDVPKQPTPTELFNILTSGVEKQFAITFIEGSTFSEWLNVLSNHPRVNYSQDRINDYVASFSPSKVDEQIYQFARVEGQFFPDTYHFNANTKAVALLQRANKTLTSKLDNLWQNRQVDVPLKNKHEALVMASIIEKETGIPSERETIASAFTNRLNRKMRLQTDPTVIYGAANDYNGDITFKHLRHKNVYNTYHIKGLPPTPIAMPSEGAIKAALHPADTPYIYFVASGDGGHVFSTNLKDHNRALQRYLQRIKSK